MQLDFFNYKWNSVHKPCLAVLGRSAFLVFLSIVFQSCIIGVKAHSPAKKISKFQKSCFYDVKILSEFLQQINGFAESIDKNMHVKDMRYFVGVGN